MKMSEIHGKAIDYFLGRLAKKHIASAVEREIDLERKYWADRFSGNNLDWEALMQRERIEHQHKMSDMKHKLKSLEEELDSYVASSEMTPRGRMADATKRIVHIQCCRYPIHDLEVSINDLEQAVSSLSQGNLGKQSEIQALNEEGAALRANVDTWKTEFYRTIDRMNELYRDSNPGFPRNLTQQDDDPVVDPTVD